jgi:hypothetical protein
MKNEPHPPLPKLPKALLAVKTVTPTPSFSPSGRWDAALAHQYPPPGGAQPLREHMRYAESMLNAGYYNDVAGKVDEVCGFLVEAEAYIRRGGRAR